MRIESGRKEITGSTCGPFGSKAGLCFNYFGLYSFSHKNSYAETVYLRKDMSSTQRKRFQNYVEKFLNWFWKKKNETLSINRNRPNRNCDTILKWNLLVSLETELCHVIVFFGGGRERRTILWVNVFAEADTWEDALLRTHTWYFSGNCLKRNHVMFC